jgi:hypothetical protein
MFIARPADGSDEVIGGGTVERVLVDRARFLAGVQTPVVDLG